jgi:hypothetical protein
MRLSVVSAIPSGDPMKESIPLRRSRTAALSGSAIGVKRLPRG